MFVPGLPAALPQPHLDLEAQRTTSSQHWRQAPGFHLGVRNPRP